MTSRFTKTLVLTAALTSPFVAPMAAHANTSGLQVDQQAVELVSASWKDTAAAYDGLKTGNTAQARRNLDAAIAKLSRANAKDPTLGVAVSNSNVPSTVQGVHERLKTVKTRLASGEITQVQTELETLLGAAGVI